MIDLESSWEVKVYKVMLQNTEALLEARKCILNGLSTGR